MKKASKKKNVTISEFEQQVAEVEGRRICLGAPSDLVVPSYPYTERLPATATFNDLLELRVMPLIRKALRKQRAKNV
jgi:hypothetical protein